MFLGYFDESADQTEKKIFVVGGFLGHYEQWSALERRWKELLEKYEIYYYHAVEAQHARKQFAKPPAIPVCPLPRGTGQPRPHEKIFMTITPNAHAMVRRAENGTGALRAGGRRCILAVVPKGPATIPGNSSMEKKTMKKLLWFVLLLALLTPGLAMAQSAFDGTWKVDIKTAQFPTKPDVYLLQDGMYHCKTCVPAIGIKADGQDQKVTGHPYFDTMSIKLVDDRTIEETDKKNGKVVATSKTWASADGNKLMFEFTDSSDSNADPVTGKGEETRVAKGPTGSHAISGSWRASKMESVSDNGLVFTYKVAGDSLTMTNLTGQSYTAKLDGTEAPYKGDPGTTTVSVKKLDTNKMEETDKREGKVISIARMTLSADGKSMTIAVDDKLHGTTMQFTALKQ